MITSKQTEWTREFLLALCGNAEERANAKEIAESLRKLWIVAKAAEMNPYPRSPKLAEALDAVRQPGAARVQP